MRGTQNLSSINHGGEILCAFICVFYTKSLLPREGKFCVPVSIMCWEVRVRVRVVICSVYVYFLGITLFFCIVCTLYIVLYNQIAVLPH